MYKNNYASGLTKEYLKNVIKIKDIELIKDEKGIVREAIVYRDTRRGTVHMSWACGKHKYVNDVYYPNFKFDVNGKSKSITAARLIYCWFVGDIPDMYVIDHIYNEKEDLTPEHLQCITVEQNIVKRYTDNGQMQRDYIHNNLKTDR